MRINPLIVIGILIVALVIYFLVRPKYSCYESSEDKEPKEDPKDPKDSKDSKETDESDESDETDESVESEEKEYKKKHTQMNTSDSTNTLLDDNSSTSMPFSTYEPKPMKLSSATTKFVPVPSDYLAELQASAAMNANNIQTLNDITERLNADAVNYRAGKKSN